MCYINVLVVLCVRRAFAITVASTEEMLAVNEKKYWSLLELDLLSVCVVGSFSCRLCVFIVPKNPDI